MIRQVLPPSVEQIEAARRVIADHLVPTPTITLSLRGRPVLVKMESLQPTGSFKVRGALAAVDASRRDDPDGAVVTWPATTDSGSLASSVLVSRRRSSSPRTRRPPK